MIAVERQTGRTPPELLNMVQCPEMLYYVWEYFLMLNNKRQSGMGVNPISWCETKAFFDLINIEPTQEELSILSKLDSIALNYFAEQQKEEQKRNSKNNK